MRKDENQGSILDLSFGEKSRVAEGDELPRGVRGHTTPGNFINEYALRCDLVHFECKVKYSVPN